MTSDLSFIVDAALRFRLELGLDAVEELVEALGWADLGASHDAGRIVVHGDEDDEVAGRGGEDGGSGGVALGAVETRRANRGMRRSRSSRQSQGGCRTAGSG
jgi:hypothetical protein